MATSTFEPIASAEPIALLEKEIDTLTADGALVTQQGPFDVFLTQAPQIPHLLAEIGRLREITFREVGEGTGRARDLDRFDTYYSHLFLWDREKRQIGGGYRLGRTDLILAAHGFSGLYLSTLCEVDEPLLELLDPALECGRSWIRASYQQSLHGLLGLWKGIGSFVAHNPRYHRLFGAVSTSDDYTRISQSLIVKFLRKKHTRQDWRGLVHPWVPVGENEDDLPTAIDSIEAVSAEVSRGEPDGKGVPVLLRQYLKLNATLLDFAFNPHFQNCLEALVVVDLHQAPAPLLKRYMGKEGYRIFSGG